ncbi:hypothetical protein D9M68_327880 [compost metagenome]
MLDHPDVDHQQGDEADGVGQQRGGAGDEQRAEGAPRGVQRAMPLPHLAHHQVDVLHRMADADGEDQEWHQDRVWVQAVAEQAEQAELADHGK